MISRLALAAFILGAFGVWRLARFVLRPRSRVETLDDAWSRYAPTDREARS